MVRWEPGARERLQGAALELFGSQGFDGTTVAEIAARAGLTERTFFRYFADKREVLFTGQDAFERLFFAGLDATGSDEPMTSIGAAIGRAADFFPDEHRPWSRARQQVIDAHEALRERELLKLSSLAAALTRALTDRGVDPTSAALAAETGVTVFRTAFAAWIAPSETRSFPQLQDAVMRRLHALIDAD
ncbi:TetR family transcriptional regulator [Tersicoccus solisilvae]|uniref:TetR family transcriptional regulator n=1 Tax=Tersicoccus solisilvae TaxID=1882339 RepID=A0ABQ1PL41_9MICC|nr:TetR family transcriptional regulator [Tersicoccus solisilvae]GGC98899.1 TetR family transcriptional regulator [Tersicoccus solisilvae]